MPSIFDTQMKIEDTGDWHFLSTFFDNKEDGRAAPVAGEDGIVDTSPSLGERGIREMSQILQAQSIVSESKPVFVANHYRAIADLAMLHLCKGQVPTITTARQINQWLDTEEQVEHLVSEYLYPLRSQLDEDAVRIFDQWIVTVIYE